MSYYQHQSLPLCQITNHSCSKLTCFIITPSKPCGTEETTLNHLSGLDLEYNYTVSGDYKHYTRFKKKDWDFKEVLCKWFRFDTYNQDFAVVSLKCVIQTSFFKMISPQMPPGSAVNANHNTLMNSNRPEVSFGHSITPRVSLIKAMWTSIKIAMFPATLEWNFNEKHDICNT